MAESGIGVGDGRGEEAALDRQGKEIKPIASQPNVFIGDDINREIKTAVI